MRIIVALLFGFFIFFYAGGLIQQISKRALPTIIGVITLLVGLLLIIFGESLVAAPLNALLGVFLLGSGLGISFYHLLSEGYLFSRQREYTFVKRHDKGVERFLEIMPGAVVWIAITSPIWLSFIYPFAVAYLVLIATIYWLFNALKIAILIFLGYKKFQYAKSQNWESNLERDFPHEWKEYYHLILLPRYNESIEILGPAIAAIANARYPKEKILLCIGSEERGKSEQTEIINQYAKEKGKELGAVVLTNHPFGLPGEIPGPATNRNWMAKEALKLLEKRNISPKNVLVTTLDSDFVIDPQFLAGATHKYLATPAKERDKRSYTGVFFFYNNYWQAPTPMRLIAAGTSFWQLAEMVGSDKYRNYASMTMNFQSMLDIGLWIPNKVNDDSGFYWKAYYHFKGDYKVLPHYLPLNGDTVLDSTLWRTFKNQYQQQKRWAYGVEHIPYVVTQYFKNRDFDFWEKTDNVIFALWGYIRWGMLSLFVTFAGMLIPIINPSYAHSVLSYNVPLISSWILTAAFLGMFATIFIHEKTVPPRPKEWSIIKKLWSYIQWIMVPVLMITISTVPAIDALTSLMLGRYIEYHTTNKVRIATNAS